MAQFGTYNNNQNNNRPELSVYSNYRMNNAESKVDPTCLTFRYWRTNLCIGIFPRKNTGNDDVSFDMSNGITIYLSHSKARIFKHEVENFLQDPVKYNAVGVPSGQAVITISNGSEYGKSNPILTIRKVNENGEVVASFAYEFKRDYHFSIRNYDGKNFDSVYEDYQNLEIEQLLTVLEEYIKATTNAVAFTVMEQRSYSATRVEDKINAIASSLGVQVTGNSKPKYNNSSYFASGGNTGNENNNVSYSSGTLEDLE